MAIVYDNSTNTINLGDASIKRKGANALETSGSLDVGSLKITNSGLTFADNTTMNTAPTGGGSSGITDIYNNTARYALIDAVGQSVWCVSTGTVFGGKSWSRSGTSLTITHNSHGHSVGERVIIRNTNVFYQVALITSVNANDFTVTCADTGATSGTSGAYLMGFTYAHNSQTAGSIASGTLYAPANSDLQLLSLRINFGANQRSGNTYTFTLPSSSVSGAGDNSSLDNLYTPLLGVRQLTTGLLPAVSATLTSNAGSNLSSFLIGSLPVPATPTTIAILF